ncbi:hypothetical protein [Streptomyces lydicus]|uniref:hypothetical protein n=1 Tax=Streptomyces lydicus TaxID=47763 RepID=UPI001013246D|nr:hypothetical protein [Streptomyces lydicus]MCZ1012091.1 hypothetical protein [Streptomyces lydicus]
MPKHIYICDTCGQDETCTSKQAAQRLRRTHRILAHGGLPTRHERIVPVPKWGGIPRFIAIWAGIALVLLAIDYLLPLFG